MKGIDISDYQRGLDIASLKKQGIEFLLLKVGEGSTLVDKSFDEFYQAAAEAGIPVGAWFYSYATTEEIAIRDAKRALSLVGGKPLPLGIYIDVEDGSQMALRDSVLTAVVKAFCDTIRSAGYRPGAYGSALNLWGKVGPSYLGDDVLVWTAWWNKSNPPKPCDIWQTSEKGTISGYLGYVDTDKSMSERFEALVKNQPSPEPQPEPEPEPAPEPISYEPFSIEGIPVLKNGDVGDTVKAAQGELIAYGHPCGGKKDWQGAEHPDGIFGNVTQSSVQAFQREHNLPDSGVIDQKTRKALLGL